MSRVSKLGHNVLFVDPPINTGWVFMKHFLEGRWPLRRLLTQRYKDEKVEVLSPLNIHPVYSKLSVKHANRIDKLAKKIFDKKRKTILWVYHVEMLFLENYLRDINYDILVYDCVDNYEAFPAYKSEEKKKWISEQEKMLATRANIVFATTPGLIEKLKKHNPNTYYTPNVGDYDRFFDIRKSKEEEPEKLREIPHPRVMFTGAIDEYKFDKELVKKIAMDFPSYSFVIIGPSAYKDRWVTEKALGFEDFNNIHFLGPVDYTKLPNYISKADVLMIPYQLNDYTVGGCFPVKFHNYLASGYPVVVTDLPAYAPFYEACYISKDYNEFSQNIRKALEEESISAIKKRQKVASQNTWDQKVTKMLSLINKL
ncbi:glycosyltransferase [Patescibacteria group bacterium]